MGYSCIMIFRVIEVYTCILPDIKMSLNKHIFSRDVLLTPV